MKLKALLFSLCLATPAVAQSSFPITDPFLYRHIAANGTTTISGVHVLHTVCINTKGASSNSLKIEDALTDTTPVVAIMDTTVNFGCFTYDIAFQTGITIVIATGTAADVTVSYR